MKLFYRIAALLLALCLLALPVLAEEEDDWEYEGGMESNAPDIELKSNPSTGYHWFFTCDEPDVVDVAENGFVSDDEDLLGAPGKECFRFYGSEEGFAIVTFTYARTAEEEPLYTVTYHLIVDEQLNVLIFQNTIEAN